MTYKIFEIIGHQNVYETQQVALEMQIIPHFSDNIKRIRRKKFFR